MVLSYSSEIEFRPLLVIHHEHPHQQELPTSPPIAISPYSATLCYEVRYERHEHRLQPSILTANLVIYTHQGTYIDFDLKSTTIGPIVRRRLLTRCAKVMKDL